jgi:hypothetical protein
MAAHEDFQVRLFHRIDPEIGERVRSLLTAEQPDVVVYGREERLISDFGYHGHPDWRAFTTIGLFSLGLNRSSKEFLTEFVGATYHGEVAAVEEYGRQHPDVALRPIADEGALEFLDALLPDGINRQEHIGRLNLMTMGAVRSSVRASYARIDGDISPVSFDPVAAAFTRLEQASARPSESTLGESKGTVVYLCPVQDFRLLKNYETAGVSSIMARTRPASQAQYAA